MNINQLIDAFYYNDGVLYWKKSGKVAGTPHHTGYIQVGYKGKLYGAHRLIFAIHHKWLPEVIDHIDGNRSNNAIENLRPASWSQNLQNMKLRKSNTSGIKNVSWDKERKKWLVQINIDKKRVNFGRFDDLELADLVATEARNKYHGLFARHV
jgi:hypothetical protein